MKRRKLLCLFLAALMLLSLTACGKGASGPPAGHTFAPPQADLCPQAGLGLPVGGHTCARSGFRVVWRAALG